MSYFLAIETATKNCSVALFEDSLLMECLDLENGYSHAENLAPFAQQLLKKHSITATKIDAMAVSMGPGSYTGLRIGVAFAKGFCFAQNIPLISISTLEAMTVGALNDVTDMEALYCPMIDARRLEVYQSVFDSKLNSIIEISAHILENTSFAKLLEKSKMYFFGDGSLKAKEIIKSSNAIFLNSNYTSSKNFGELIHSSFVKNKFEDLAYFEPYYLKDFVAGTPKKLV